MKSGDPTAFTSLRLRLRGVFLLEAPLRRASVRSAEQQRVVRRLFDAARARSEAAEDMLARGNVPMCVDLSRGAALLYVRAVLASEVSAGAVRFASGAAWQQFDRLVSRGAFPSPSPSALAATHVLSDLRPLVWDELSPDDARAQARALAPALEWLRGLVEPRLVSQLQHQRLYRLAALALTTLGLAWWATWAIFSPRNLALHRPVTVSSHYSEVTEPDGGLVDGVIEQPYGVHTGADDPPFVMVDLGRSYRIRLVKIYNRGDAFFDASLPLTLEFSQDAEDFSEVDQRTTTFTQEDPWVFVAHGKPARYLRVRGTPGGSVVLAELEAYGN